jgi:hypothetical protein
MEAAQTANPPSFETVWAALQELTASQKETDRQIQDFNIRSGALTNLFGEVAEYMIAPNLHEKFTEFGLNFPRANPNVSVNDKVNNIFLEIDVMLENGNKAMLVEIKNKLTIERINNQIWLF